MNHFILSLIFIFTQNCMPAHAGFPPTSTKGSGDTNPVTTFEIDTSNIPITHTGVKASLGTIPIAGGGTGQVTKSTAFDALSPMTTGGDIIYGGASGTGTRLSNGAAGQFLMSNGTTLAPSWNVGTGGAISPTVQRFTTGSGTYTTPTSPAPLYIIVEMVGGGGGGAGSAGTATGGTAGGSTTFGASLTASGGGAGGLGGNGGTGGTNTISTGTTLINAPGGGGGAGMFQPASGSTMNSGVGGGSFFGGAGGSVTNGTAGIAAGANTGSGGGGAAIGSGNSGTTGSGGGAGGYAKVLITSPSATYAYCIGNTNVSCSGGSGGSAGSGFAGGTGGSGLIEVTEYYANGAIGTATNVTGVVAIANGGTGLSSIGSVNAVLTSDGTNAAWVVPQAYSSTITGTISTTSTSITDLTVSGLTNTAFSGDAAPVNFPTVATSSSSAGWTFTPTKLGVLKFVVTVESVGSANSNALLAVYDGSNNQLTPGAVSNLPTNGATQTVTLAGFLNITSLSSTTIKLRGSITAGTMTVPFASVSMNY